MTEEKLTTATKGFNLEKVTKMVFGIAWILYSCYYCDSYYHFHSGYYWLDYYYYVVEDRGVVYWVLQILLGVWSVVLCLLFCSLPLILKRIYKAVRVRIFRHEKGRRWALRTKWALRKKLNVRRLLSWIGICFVLLSIYSAGLLFVVYNYTCFNELIPFMRVALVGFVILFAVIPLPYILDYWFHRRNLWGLILAVTIVSFPLAKRLSSYSMVPKASMITPEDVCLYVFLLLCVITAVRVIWNIVSAPRIPRRLTCGILITLAILTAAITANHMWHMREIGKCLAKYDSRKLYYEPSVVSIADKKTAFQWSIWRMDRMITCFGYHKPKGLVALIVLKDNFINICFEGIPHITRGPIIWEGEEGAVCFGEMPVPIARPDIFSPIDRSRTTSIVYKRIY